MPYYLLLVLSIQLVYLLVLRCPYTALKYNRYSFCVAMYAVYNVGRVQCMPCTMYAVYNVYHVQCMPCTM